MTIFPASSHYFAIIIIRKFTFFSAKYPCGPNTSRWNIGGFGDGVGHVDFMLFVSISFALGSQWWNMGLRQLS